MLASSAFDWLYLRFIIRFICANKSKIVGGYIIPVRTVLWIVYNGQTFALTSESPHFWTSMQRLTVQLRQPNYTHFVMTDKRQLVIQRPLYIRPGREMHTDRYVVHHRQGNVSL